MKEINSIDKEMLIHSVVASSQKQDTTPVLNKAPQTLQYVELMSKSFKFVCQKCGKRFRSKP